jgi:hypothetical protein
MRRFLFAASLFSLLAIACMDPLHDYQECVQIETARCKLRQDCKKSGNAVFKEKFKDFDYDTCVAYAKEHCRTREIGGGDENVWQNWSDKDVDKCADAILALFPNHCVDLDPSVDETEWDFMDDVCGFLNKIEKEEPEEDAGTEEETPDAG